MKIKKLSDPILLELSRLKVFHRTLIILALILSITFIFLSCNKQKNLIQKESFIALQKIDRAFAYDIDYVKFLVIYASQQLSDMNGDEKKIEKLLATLLTRYTQNGQNNDVALTWNAFSWINNKNMLSVDGSSGILERALDVSNRDYLAFTSKTSNKIIFGKPILGALSQRYLIPAGSGVFSRRGIYLGTLVFGFDIEKVIEKLERITDNQHLSFVILKEKEFVFSSKNFNMKNLKQIEPLLPKIDEQEFDRNIMIQQSGSLFNDEVAISLKKMQNYPFTIAVLYEKEDYRDILFGNFLKNLIYVVLAFVAIALFDYFLVIKKHKSNK